MIRRSLTASLAAALLLVSLVGGQALAARPVFVFSTQLTGAAEVPGPGDTDALGHAVIMIEPANDRVCWVLKWNRVDGTVFASHIHGPATTTQAAGILVHLFGIVEFGEQGINKGCMQDPALSATLDAMVADPQLYYVNIHSLPDFGPGAIRGQLG